jgi:hypothetical protein
VAAPALGGNRSLSDAQDQLCDLQFRPRELEDIINTEAPSGATGHQRDFRQRRRELSKVSHGKACSKRAIAHTLVTDFGVLDLAERAFYR